MMDLYLGGFHEPFRYDLIVKAPAIGGGANGYRHAVHPGRHVPHGLDGAEYAWGNEFTPGNRQMANTWQGAFPRENLSLDGYERTSPVTAFPPNGYGAFDMIGSVWEWTADWYSHRHEADAQKACCIPENPRGGREDGSYDPCQSNIRIPQKVIKGGSHLCAPNYCQRYRPAARHVEPVDTSTSHVGFRCIIGKRSREEGRHHE